MIFDSMVAFFNDMLDARPSLTAFSYEKAVRGVGTASAQHNLGIRSSCRNEACPRDYIQRSPDKSRYATMFSS